MEKANQFTGLSQVYQAARPAYAKGFLSDLVPRYGVTQNAVAADVGSGTGIFARQMLEQGLNVYCVEPNDDMRSKAEEMLGGFEKCRFIAGDASNTGLPDNSVNLVTAAQAFHWFDAAAFRKECLRILKPDGLTFLIWNMRDPESPFTRDCHAIFKRYCPRFKGFGGGILRDDPRIRLFFADQYERVVYENPQYYGKKKFIDRSLSGSYSLQEGDPAYLEYLHALEALFDRYAVDGVVEMPNQTIVYVGKVK